MKVMCFTYLCKLLVAAEVDALSSVRFLTRCSALDKETMPNLCSTGTLVMGISPSEHFARGVGVGGARVCVAMTTANFLSRKIPLANDIV